MCIPCKCISYKKGSGSIKAQRKYSITKLNSHDKKVLNKYTKFYTNMLESNTASVYTLMEENYSKRGQ